MYGGLAPPFVTAIVGEVNVMSLMQPRYALVATPAAAGSNAAMPW
jgi:hypothetical protein